MLHWIIKFHHTYSSLNIQKDVLRILQIVLFNVFFFFLFYLLGNMLILSWSFTCQTFLFSSSLHTRTINVSSYKCRFPSFITKTEQKKNTHKMNTKSLPNFRQAHEYFNRLYIICRYIYCCAYTFPGYVKLKLSKVKIT